MRFFQRGRGQTQSSRRAERDTQLVLVERIKDLDRTIDLLTAQLDYDDIHTESLTWRIIWQKRVNAIRERDRLMQQLMDAPAIHARTFGINAPAAGGSRKRRGGTSLMKVGDCMFPISDVDQFCQNNEGIMDGAVYEEAGCRATVGVNDCITAWTILNDVMRRVPPRSGGKRRTRKRRRTRRRR